jgi:biopolymer transport protein ExbD
MQLGQVRASALGGSQLEGNSPMMKALLITAAAFALAAPVLAQQATPPSDASTASPPTTAAPAMPAADTFAKIDADKSGSLTLAEIKMVDVSVTQADFDKYDANKDKALSSAEFDKWQAAHKMAKPGKAG